MPPRKQKARGKGKEKVDDSEPWEDPPYIKWMKEQCENGNTQGKIMREAAPRRDGAGSSGARGAHADSSDGGGDTDFSDDNLEEIVSSSGSEDDSDNSNAKDSSDEEDSDADPAGSDAGPSTRKRRRTPSPMPPKRSRVNETATMAAAKVIADTITTCNAQALRQLSDTVQLLVTAIHVAATLGRAPPPQPQPVSPPPPANAHALTVTDGNEDSPALDREAGDNPHDRDDEARDDRTSD
ncbi:unnamed protein product [Closterium sp. NIES-64]|nr:unnamed protein product [Closterium sp. NIES-64]